jgi:hypothetical protein
MSLPLRLPVDLMQTKWKAELDPLLANPANSILLLKNVPLVVGANVINHRLNALPNGWFIADINAAATVYRSAPLTDLTITLTSSAVATITLGVF